MREIVQFSENCFYRLEMNQNLLVLKFLDNSETLSRLHILNILELKYKFKIDTNHDYFLAISLFIVLIRTDNS